MTSGHPSFLVTGASGMIGRHAVGKLLEDGRRVRALVHERELPPPLAERVEVVRGDIEDAAVCRRAVDGIQAVLHLAGLAHQSAEPARFHRVNAKGSESLALAAAAAGVERFVLMSSIAVYGSAEGWLDETVPVSPDTPYGASKVAAEERVAGILGSGAARLVVLRPSVVYGEADRGNTMRLVRAIDRRRFILIGGAVRKSMIHADDVADAAIRAMDHPAAEGVYLLADPRPYPLREVVQRIAEGLGRRVPTLPVPRPVVSAAAAAAMAAATAIRRRPPITRRDVEVWFRDTLVRPERLRRELGFTSRVGLDEGIRRTLAAYKDPV